MTAESTPVSGRRPATILTRWAVVALLAVGAIVSLFPFYWMAVSATHSTADLFTSPPPFVPGGQILENLTRLQDEVGFARVVLNSVLIAVIYTVLGTLVSAMAGYGFAKYRFRGRGVLFGLILATMFIKP